MPDSVKERIEQQLVADLKSELSLPDKDVQRHERGGNKAVADGAGELPDAWLLVTFHEEDELGPNDEAVIGMESLILPFTVDAHVLTVPSGETTQNFANEWIAKLKQAVLQNEYREEGGAGSGGTELALWTRITGTFGPIPDDENRETVAGIEGELHYRHLRADPYSVG